MQLKDRIALITGASRGIGRAVALRFAKEGAHVIACARNAGALEELDDDIRSFGGRCTLLPLNVTQNDKIDGLGPTVYQRWQKLDIFVGNAATLGPMSPLSHIKDEEWQSTLDVNLTANWRLLRTLDPVLRLSDAGRVIMVSSSAARSPRAYWSAYAATKAGLEAITKSYAEEIENTAIRANIINPGATATRMRAQAFPGEDQTQLTQPEDLTDLFVSLAVPGCILNGQVIDYKKEARDE